jgi:hypothetical protein
VKVAENNGECRCDCAVVGLGPVGAVAANLLGIAGINAIALDALPVRSGWITR